MFISPNISKNSLFHYSRLNQLHQAIIKDAITACMIAYDWKYSFGNIPGSDGSRTSIETSPDSLALSYERILQSTDINNSLDKTSTVYLAAKATVTIPNEDLAALATFLVSSSNNQDLFKNTTTEYSFR